MAGKGVGYEILVIIAIKLDETMHLEKCRAVELQLTASHESLAEAPSVKHHVHVKVQTGTSETNNDKEPQCTDGIINPGYISSPKIEPDVIMPTTPVSPEVHNSQELEHASHMTSSCTRSTDSSTLRVDIADIDGEESMNLTTTHLKLCKRQVLRPYWKLLMLIGWRGFGREYINSGSRGWRFLNTVYPMFIVLLLLYTYVYEIVACQWKLNVVKDTRVLTTTTTTVPTTLTPNATTPGWFPFYPIGTAISQLPTKNLTQSQKSYPPACEHIVTTYIIPNLLHFVAFAMGIYHFRVQENEQLYALMESVFLQATPNYNRSASQQKMIRNMRAFFFVSAFWVIIIMGMQALYEWAFDFPKMAFFIKTGSTIHWVLFGLEILGIMIVNSIFVAVVTNYFTQCEMILFYIKAVTLRLQEKSTDLKNAMKDILVVRRNLSVLNGPIARMTALVSVIFAELTIIGTSILVLNENNQYKVWMYRSIYPLIWFVILSVPLIQAARVNSVCNRFQKIALETRVFGYKGSSLIELDSFLNFVSLTRLRAKLFHIPILPSYLIAFTVLCLFVILILLQTSVIGAAHFF